MTAITENQRLLDLRSEIEVPQLTNITHKLNCNLRLERREM